MTKITEPLPMPNQMIVNGTQAIPAIACRNESTGLNVSATCRLSAIASPSGSASAMPIANPAASRARLASTLRSNDPSSTDSRANANTSPIEGNMYAG